MPAIIQSHYRLTQAGQTLTVAGNMTVNYPIWLAPVLKLFRLCGALVDLQGADLSVEVKKWRHDDPLVLYWQRHIQDGQGRCCVFASRMVWRQDHELVEWVGLGFGIRLRLSVEQGKLVYRSNGHLLKLGAFVLPIPDTLLLGHAFINEETVSEEVFRLHFEIVHPLWGKTYYYGGVFKVCSYSEIEISIAATLFL